MSSAPPSDTPLINVSHLSKFFGLRPALRDVSFAVGGGRAVALLGVNGSGKTTLLRILSGLSKPSGGTVNIGGWQIPEEVDAVRAQLGVVAHLPLLYDELTAKENLDFYARLYGVSASNGHINAALERVGLSKQRDLLARTFSRGMQQRLAIARAMLHDPAIMLLDEPYTGLDVHGAAMLDSLIREWKQAGRTLILSLHDLERAALVCDDALILSRGRAAVCQPLSALTNLAAVFAEVTA